MKRYMVVIAVLGALVLAFGSATLAFADSPAGTRQGLGQGMRGGQGTMWNRDAGQEGPLHDAIVASMSTTLGTDAAQLEARLDAGETMWQVAESAGLSADEFTAAFQQARAVALDQAVADGTITQAQADWMAQRAGRGMQAGRQGLGNGLCDGTGTALGLGGGGARWSAQSN